MHVLRSSAERLSQVRSVPNLFSRERQRGFDPRRPQGQLVTHQEHTARNLP